MSKFVTIGYLSDPVKIDLVQNVLTEAEIPHSLPGKMVYSVHPAFPIGRGVPLQVPEEFVDEALEILKSHSLLKEEFEDPPKLRVVKDRDHSRIGPKWFLLALLIFAVLLLILQSYRA